MVDLQGVSMIYLGPAGIPISCKKRSTLACLEYLSKIGLNAMEVEFVRGVKMSEKLAEEIGRVAKRFGIKLSVHAPYFINLCSEDEEKVKASKRRILEALDRAQRMGAECVVVHAGYYGRMEKDEAMEKIMVELTDIIERGGEEPKLAIETMAKQTQFGSLEEVLELCKRMKKRVVPLVDFMHIFVRNGGKIDYGQVLDKLEKMGFEHIHSHFSNSKYNINTKRFMDVHVPMNKHPPFEPLAEEIVKRGTNITIISESPVLEKDSLKMREIIKKVSVQTRSVYGSRKVN